MYQILNVRPDGIDARTVLCVDEGKVKLVVTSCAASGGYDAIYARLAYVLGPPTTFYRSDDYYERVETDRFFTYPHVSAVIWDSGEYKVELAMNPLGNMTQFFYIAAYEESFDGSFTTYGYDYPTPVDYSRGTAMAFDDSCIYAYPGLFSEDADAILERFDAVPLYEGEPFETYVGDDNIPITYRIDGMKLFGHPAAMDLQAFAKNGRIERVSLVLDVADMPPEDIQRLYFQVMERVRSFPNISTESHRNDNVQEITDVESFDPANWGYPSGFLLVHEWSFKRGEILSGASLYTHSGREGYPKEIKHQLRLDVSLRQD